MSGIPTPPGPHIQPHSLSGVPPSQQVDLPIPGDPAVFGENFTQSFTGVDFKISAVLPYDIDLNQDDTSYRKYLSTIADLEFLRAFHLQQGATSDAASVGALLGQMQQQAQQEGTRLEGKFIKTFAEVQTLSVTTRRSVNPVRRLGETAPACYVKGPRTVAGSIIFILLQEDVLLDLYRRDANDLTHDGEPYFVMDRLPPFNILITGINEYGHVIEGGLFGVTLIAGGYTLSVDDLFTEQQYTYVARWMMPLTKRERHDEILTRLKRYSTLSGRGAVSEIGRTPSSGMRPGASSVHSSRHLSRGSTLRTDIPR